MDTKQQHTTDDTLETILTALFLILAVVVIFVFIHIRYQDRCSHNNRQYHGGNKQEAKKPTGQGNPGDKTRRIDKDFFDPSDLSDPLNPLSPLSPFNPANPVYQ